MTTGNTDVRRVSRKEVRFLPAFGNNDAPVTLNDLLNSTFENCYFFPFRGAEKEEATYFIEDSRDITSIKPTVHIEISNIDAIIDQLGGSAEDYKITVSCVVSRLNNYELVATFNLNECPLNWKVPESKEHIFQSLSRSEIVVSLIYVGQSIESSQIDPGMALKRRFFNINPPVASSLPFPVNYADFEEGQEYPKESLWVVEWREEDSFDFPIDQILEVKVNKKAKERLDKAADAKGTDYIAWKILAMEIMTEICAVIIEKGDTPGDDDPDNPESAVQQLYSRLKQVSGENYDSIKDWVDPEEPGNNKLRGYVAKLFHLIQEEQEETNEG